MTVAPAVTRPTGIHHHSLCLGGAGVAGPRSVNRISVELGMPTAIASRMAMAPVSLDEKATPSW